MKHIETDPDQSSSLPVSETGRAPGGHESGGEWMVAVLIILYILNACDRTILSLMVTPMKRDLGLNDGQLGLLLGLAFATFYAFCSIPAGILADRYSRRNILWAGVSLWSVATIACGLATSFHELLFARMLLGASEASLLPVAISLIGDRFPPAARGRAMSFLVAGGVIGNSAALAIGGIAVQFLDRTSSVTLVGDLTARGWQIPFLVLGISGLILGTLTRTFAEPVRAGSLEVREALVSIIVMRKAVILSIIGTYVLQAMLLFSSNLWLPTYMVREFAWLPAQAGLALGLINLVSAAGGTAVAGYVVDNVTRKGYADAHYRVLFFSTLIALPVGIGSFLAPSAGIFLALFFVFSLFGLSYAGYCLATVQSISPPHVRGRMGALFLMVQTLIGAGVGPTLVGTVADGLGGPSELGSSLALLFATVMPIVLLSAYFGRRSLAEAVIRTDNESHR